MARRHGEEGPTGRSARFCAHPAGCPDPEDCIGKPGECYQHEDTPTGSDGSAVAVRRPIPETDLPLVERLAQADPYERGNYPLAGGMAYAAVAGAIETALCYISRNSPRDGCAMGDE